MSRFLASLLCLLLLVTFVSAQTTPSPANSVAVENSVQERVGPPPVNATPKELEETGDRLRARKLYTDAIDYYNAAIRRGTETAELRNKLGMAKLLLQRDDSRKEFERAVKLNPNNPDPRCNLGVYWYLLKKNNRRAIHEYQEAIRLEGGRASFHSALGAAYLDSARRHSGHTQLEEYARADEEYAKALQLDPEVFERHSPYAVSAHPMPQEDRAHFYFVLAKIYAQRGDSERALQYLAKAREDGYAKLSEAMTDNEFVGLRKDPRFVQVLNPKPTGEPQ